MAKWAVLYEDSEGERILNYFASEIDAKVVYWHYVALRRKKVEIVKESPIEDVDILRALAMGQAPSLNKLIKR